MKTFRGKKDDDTKEITEHQISIYKISDISVRDTEEISRSMPLVTLTYRTKIIFED
jgi:hypothetical protein